MRTVLAGAAALAVAALPIAAFATPAAAADDASVVVFHGVPGLTVDVYASADATYTAEEALLTDFEPGTITEPVKIPGGSYNLAVFPANADPSGDPAIEANDVTVPAGANITVAAHLDADGHAGAHPLRQRRQQGRRRPGPAHRAPHRGRTRPSTSSPGARRSSPT